MVTSLVSPTRGFTFRFCVSGGERFFPRVGGMAVSSALGGSPQSVVPQARSPARLIISHGKPPKALLVFDYPGGAKRHDTGIAQ